MAQVHQVLATLSYGDAIGHEVLGIQRALLAAGHASEIFVETAHPKLEPLTRDYRELKDSVGPDDLLIHHFSIGSKASRVAYATPAKMILVYHNITPPHYFLGVNDELVRRCYLGRRELRAYVGRCELALGDSEFNRQELESLGFPRTGVLPVVPDFSHLDVERDPMLAAPFDDGWTNILFVGRVIPNKRFDALIRSFHVYRTRFNPRSRLLLVGSTAGFEEHRTLLLALAARLGTPDVHLTGQVTNGQLAAFYEVADLFLSASEHEGFCVPIIEAFYMGVPVLAYAATAVPGTMDGGGVLYDSQDPFEVGGAHRRDHARCRSARTRARLAGRGAGSAAGPRFRRHRSGFRRAHAAGTTSGDAPRSVRLLATVRRARKALGAQAAAARVV